MLEPTITPLDYKPMTVKLNGKPIQTEGLPFPNEVNFLSPSRHYSFIGLGTLLGFSLFAQPSYPVARENYKVNFIDAEAAYDEMTKFIEFLHTLAQGLENLAWAMFSLSIAVGASIFVWKIVKTLRQHY